MDTSSNFFTITATFVVAMILMLMPLPDWARAYRPEWIVLALIYWSIAVPKKVGVGIAWMLGLCVDVIQGAFTRPTRTRFCHYGLHCHSLPSTRARIPITSTSHVCGYDFITLHEHIIMDFRNLRRRP